ncbi:thioesterase family protein [Cryomorphaceae bacterium 1068]|nr:thioesterase family protein [Cryomorphaceae bacterium 1068]
MTHTTTFRVRYSETDRMGYMYYGNYAAWFEVGRVELLRSLGLTYRKIEDDGVILPVRDFTVRYFKPVKYDDEVYLNTNLTDLSGAKITFDFVLANAQGEKLCTSTIVLVFCDKDSGRPTRAPQQLVEAFGG